MAQTTLGAFKIVAAKKGMTVEEYISKIETHKWCRIGKHWQPRELFNTDNSRHDKLSPKCRECCRVNRPYKSLKGRVSTFKGKKHSDETRKRISEKVRAANLTPPMLGKNHTLEARKKISAILRIRGAKGERCHSYKDGKLAERMGQRYSSQYKRWRFDVYSRDKFTCQKCGDKKGGNLNAHHIKPFADHPELRFDVDNGITLCEGCHKKEHQKPQKKKI